VDKRTIEKYEREAKDKNRESWYMAYIMDTNEEERVKGITVEVRCAERSVACLVRPLAQGHGHLPWCCARSSAQTLNAGARTATMTTPMAAPSHHTNHNTNSDGDGSTHHTNTNGDGNARHAHAGWPRQV
jgi:hypothetical protein